MLSCLTCNAKIALDAAACAACGTKVDADGDGVPDALEKMVEDKARALIAAEKQREADDQAEAKRDEEAAKKAEERKADEAELELLEATQEEDEKTPRRAWYISKGTVVLFAVVALILGGIIFPACVEPIAGRSIVAAKVFCPGVCPTCRGPGRIFTWHESGGGYEGNVSRQICHNDVVNVDAMTWMQVEEKENEPYFLTLWTSVPLDFGLVFLVGLAIGPFLVARMKNNWRSARWVERENKIAMLRRKLGPPAKSSSEPYR